MAEALEVTIDTLIAGTSDTEPSTRAELAGLGFETLMEVVDKLADFSEAAWLTGWWSSEVIPT